MCTGSPSLNSSDYQDLTEDISSSALAIVRCITHTSPPTSVTWKRNGVAIDVDGGKYETMQIVTDRKHSHYDNTLIVNDLTEILGNPTYTCIITNSAGETFHDIRMDISISGKHIYKSVFHRHSFIYLHHLLQWKQRQKFLLHLNLPLRKNTFLLAKADLSNYDLC